MGNQRVLRAESCEEILFVCYWTVSLGFHCLNYFSESQLLLLQTFTAKKRKKGYEMRNQRVIIMQSGEEMSPKV